MANRQLKTMLHTGDILSEAPHCVQMEAASIIARDYKLPRRRPGPSGVVDRFSKSLFGLSMVDRLLRRLAMVQRAFFARLHLASMRLSLSGLNITHGHLRNRLRTPELLRDRQQWRRWFRANRLHQRRNRALRQLGRHNARIQALNGLVRESVL